MVIDVDDRLSMASSSAKNQRAPADGSPDNQNAKEIELGRGDGIVTSRHDIVLGITVADCVPILVADRRTGAFGLLHSGWRGTGILCNAVSLMRERYESVPDDLVVTLGPAISVESYPVDRARAESFAAEFGAECVAERNGQFHLDLATANERLARALGVSCVNRVDQCTAKERLLGSYRRQGSNDFTRMLVLVGYFDTSAYRNVGLAKDAPTEW
jgi:YfiH family protein